MKRKHHCEAKNFSILREHEARGFVQDLSNHYRIAEKSIYRSKSKFGGTEVSGAERLLELEQENRKLKD